MKKALLFTLVATILAGCNVDGTWGPTVVAGNSNFVTVKDAIGIPNGRLNAATKHCGRYGKSPVYQADGGDSFECSGTAWCVTYQCK